MMLNVMAASFEDNEGWFIPLIFGGMVVLGLLLTLFSKYQARKRAEAFQDLAAKLNLEFTARFGDTHLANFTHVPLLSRGSNRTVTNLMVGRSDAVNLSVFDYSYTTGSGKNRSTWAQTVVAISGGTLDLPVFAVRPENLFDKIGQVFGYQDIDLPRYPEFSRKFLLRGQNENRIREVVNHDVVRLLEGWKNRCVEGGGHHFVVYRPSCYEQPAQVPVLIREAMALYQALGGKTR